MLEGNIDIQGGFTMTHIIETQNDPEVSWETDIIALQQQMNIAELITEHNRLDAYTDAHYNDNDAADRLDNVRDAIDKTIYENNQVITIPKWGRPILNRANLEQLVSGLSDYLDRVSVQKYVEARYGNLWKWYEWVIASTFVPREALSCSSVVKKLNEYGLSAVWDKEYGRWIIVNPTFTQCMEIIPNNEGKNGEVDYLLLVANHDEASHEDEYSSIRKNIDRRLFEFYFNKPAATNPHIDVIPTLQELFGDMLATGSEAMPLMSPEGLDAWKLYYLGCTVYEPQETTTD
jgi:hypothetical protein